MCLDSPFLDLIKDAEPRTPQKDAENGLVAVPAFVFCVSVDAPLARTRHQFFKAKFPAYEQFRRVKDVRRRDEFINFD